MISKPAPPNLRIALTTPVAPHTCVKCGYELRTAKPAPGTPGARQPGPGDVLLCLDCAEPYLLRADGGFDPVDVARLPDVKRRYVERVQAELRDHNLTRRRSR